jgi:hypothetical protein
MSEQTKTMPTRDPVTGDPIFKPPFIEVGMSVYWFPDRNSKAQGAVVTEVGDRAVALLVFVPGYSNGQVKDGVHHRDDPALARGNRIENGCWDHNSLYKRLVKAFAAKEIKDA